MINLLLVEDQNILLDGLSIALQKDFNIVGKLSSANDIIKFLSTNTVDVVLSDICTTNCNCLDVVESIKKSFPKVKIILMTGILELSFIQRANELGVDSFIYKNISLDGMKNAIISTYQGYKIYPNSMPSKKTEIFDNLTDREINIFREYCKGLTRKEIAQKFNYSESTIKQIFSAILDKTDFDNMTKLAIYAVSNGFIINNDK
jgi:two-component system, NarL family, vancomycin resistance associated response regulator VraR